MPHSATQIKFYTRMKQEAVSTLTCYSHHVNAESSNIYTLKIQRKHSTNTLADIINKSNVGIP